MSKKIVIALAVAAVLVAGGGAAYWLVVVRNTGIKSPTDNFSLVSDQEATGLGENNEVYKDSSGFSFSYPLDIRITDMTPEDYYSLLTLTKGKEALKITVKDGKASEVAFPKGELIGAVTLGGISAKQYKSGNSLITAGIDSGIVYLIEGPKDGGYWEDAQNTIVSTFAFSSASASGSGTQESIEDISMEEVVE
jgi:hypothetical protein